MKKKDHYLKLLSGQKKINVMLVQFQAELANAVMVIMKKMFIDNCARY
jgi:hypothetical protein